MQAFHPGNAPFDVFVLSLECDAARREKLITRLKALGIAYRLHLGINGRKGLPTQYEHRIDRPFVEAAIRRRVTDGEWACALSHRSIYERIVEEGLPGAVVLEDDARVGRRFARFLSGRGYLASDLMLLDHHLSRLDLTGASLAAGPSLFLRVRGNPCLTTGYSISRKGAEHLLAQSRPLRGRADWPCDITSLGALASVPRMIGHPSFNFGMSNIRTDRSDAIKDAKRKGTLGRFE